MTSRVRLCFGGCGTRARACALNACARCFRLSARERAEQRAEQRAERLATRRALSMRAHVFSRRERARERMSELGAHHALTSANACA